MTYEEMRKVNKKILDMYNKRIEEIKTSEGLSLEDINYFDELPKFLEIHQHFYVCDLYLIEEFTNTHKTDHNITASTIKDSQNHILFSSEQDLKSYIFNHNFKKNVKTFTIHYIKS